MNLKNIVVTIVLVLVFAMSLGYIIKAKRAGKKCIGCSSNNQCGKCNCGCHDIEE